MRHRHDITPLNSTEYLHESFEISQPNSIPLTAEQAAVLLYAIGTASEAGEVADEIKKIVFHGRAPDRDVILKECGDVLWYMTRLLHFYGFTIEDALQHNLDKLRARYPDGFKREDGS